MRGRERVALQRYATPDEIANVVAFRACPKPAALREPASWRTTVVDVDRRGIRATFLLVAVTTAALSRVAALMDGGNLTVRVGEVLPLAEGRQAHEMLEGARGRPPGKIVLRSDSL